MGHILLLPSREMRLVSGAQECLTAQLGRFECSCQLAYLGTDYLSAEWLLATKTNYDPIFLSETHTNVC